MIDNAGKVDRAAICLAEWIERGRGYHNSDVWAQWCADTQAALEQHKADRALMAGLVKVTRLALLDHDIAKVNGKLLELEKLLR